MASSSRPDKPVVIVTGSSGLLGAALIDCLRHRFQVVGFDRDGAPQPPREVECVCVDLTDPRSIELGLARVAYAYGRRLAAVVHLAAYYDFSGEPSDLYERVNVDGTASLLGLLADGGFATELFVYSSTMLVHAPTGPGRPIDESAPLAPQWDYPRSKVAAEQRIATLHGRIPTVVLRIAGVYTDRCESIPLAQQIHRIEHRQLRGHLFPGEPSHGQSYVHRDDVLDAFLRAIDRRADLPAGTTPILIGEPETFSYKELQDTLGTLLHGGDGWALHEIPKPVARAGAWLQDKLPMPAFVKPWMIDRADDHYELDVARAQRLLGWRPRHRLIEVLPQMVADLRADPERWHRRHEIPSPGD